MQNKDILSTLQKHIGTLEGAFESMPTQNLASSTQGSAHAKPLSSVPLSSLSIHKFGEDIKGANEFIGALQSASLKLKKLLNLAQSLDSQSSIEQQNELKASMNELLDSASFMGVKLFGTSLSTSLGGKSYEIAMDNPMPLFNANGSMSDFIAYVEEKSLEVAQMLLTLSEALTEPLTPKSADSQFDFENVNAGALAQMFKGR